MGDKDCQGTQIEFCSNSILNSQYWVFVTHVLFGKFELFTHTYQFHKFHNHFHIFICTSRKFKLWHIFSMRLLIWLKCAFLTLSNYLFNDCLSSTHCHSKFSNTQLFLISMLCLWSSDIHLHLHIDTFYAMNQSYNHNLHLLNYY